MLADFPSRLRRVLLNAVRGRGVHSNRNWRMKARQIPHASGWSQKVSHLFRELAALWFLVLRKRSRNFGLVAQATPEFLLHRRRNRTRTSLAQDFLARRREQANWLAILSFLVHWAWPWELRLASA